MEDPADDPPRIFCQKSFLFVHIRSRKICAFIPEQLAQNNWPRTISQVKLVKKYWSKDIAKLFQTY
ncbi:MAG: hypothetical protein LBF22_05050 [Deltaproteobacteria bacterium]|nr:hypothetical protein [Deltaproteobacteria bacterium]